MARVSEVNVVAVDVGSLANIGWWQHTVSGETSNGRDLDALVTVVATDLLAGIPVALGFEAPLFIPNPSNATGLSRQRVGDHGRPWSAGAGTVALAFGLQQTSYVFSRLAEQVEPRVTFELEELLRGDADLLVWEAFVSGKANNREAQDPHVDDARLAVLEFNARLARGQVGSDVDETEVLNTAAAGLLASGLTKDAGMLEVPCIVVKPPERT